jgi:MFS superfamily sulfate permease-like transporter
MTSCCCTLRAGLVEVHYALHLFRTRLWDFAVFMVSFFAVMFLGIELGLLPAVAMPLITMMMEAAMPPTAILGQVEDTTAYRWAPCLGPPRPHGAPCLKKKATTSELAVG